MNGAHPVPNFAFLETACDVDAPGGVLAIARPDLPIELAPTGGSIGMPSLPVEFWQDDVAQARAALQPGQVLIVSIVGTAQPGMSEDAYVEEFATLAAMVVEAGADIVEANLSCPNVGEAEGGAVYKGTPGSRPASPGPSGAGRRGDPCCSRSAIWSSSCRTSCAASPERRTGSC